MRILAIATALAVGGLVMSGPSFAQASPPNYASGGLQHIDGWCKVVSSSYFNSQVYGYYTRCADTAAVDAAHTSMAYAPRRYRRR